MSGLLLHLLLEALFHMLFVWAHCNVHVPVQYVCSLPNDSPLSCVHCIWTLWTHSGFEANACHKNESQRQEAPNSVGGRKPMYQIQATVATAWNSMEQQQIRLDVNVTAAAGTCVGTRSSTMSSHCLVSRTSHKNLTPGHLGKFQKIVKEGPSI